MNATQPHPASNLRLPALDFLRFFAAFAVTLYHYVSSYISAEEAAGTWLQPFASVTRYGYLGVDLFFIISGFVILWSSQNRTSTEFVISRAGRLLPSFWIALLFSTACIAAFPLIAAAIGAPPLNARVLLSNATMLPSILGSPMIDGVYWTLEIETRFYALIFVLLLCNQMRHVERWLYLWLTAAIACALFELPWIVHFASLDPYGPLFISGCFFFLVMSRGAAPGRIAGLALAGVASVVLSSQQRSQFITPDALSAIVVPGLVAAFVIGFGRVVRISVSPGVARVGYVLGALTYPLYLVHATAGRIAFEALKPHMSASARLVVILTVAIAIAYVFSVTAETHGRRWFERTLRKALGSVGLGRVSSDPAR